MFQLTSQTQVSAQENLHTCSEKIMWRAMFKSYDYPMTLHVIQVAKFAIGISESRNVMCANTILSQCN